METGGVNPGDRRAIYYLIAKFKPKDVLEIGTHIGASTTCIASALASVDENKFSKITTVDVRDVNSFENKPWINFGMKQSPKEMINALGFNNNVDFIVDTSLNFSKNCSKKFDFIFLDGDHSAKTVYSEISIALKLLRNNGIILLHDFFPKGQPLWSDRKVGKGPYLAVERIKNEGIRTKALPLGKLPWPTKLGSNITSLALYLKE
jgi:predicted O-methyltransferase YrrM